MVPSDTRATLNAVARTGAPSHRQRVLELLLEHYHDLTDPMQMRNEPGEGGGLLLMPATYTASVRELERLLRRMRDDRTHPLLTLPTGEKVSVRACWWHLNEWYLKATQTLTTPNTTPKRSKGKQLKRAQVDEHGQPLKHTRVLRNAEARHQTALRGVQWLADNWSLTHEPMLPQELIAA